MNPIQITPATVGISIDFMRRTAPELARDIVCRLDSASNLALSFGLTAVQWEVLKCWPAFVQMVQEANEELGGSAGTSERARRKAALAVAEVVVQDMAVISGDPKVAARDRIAAAELLKDVACLGSRAQVAAAAAGGAAVGFGGALIQIVMPGGGQLQIGEAPVDRPVVPVIEGESERVA